jgi:hypothetical protein
VPQRKPGIHKTQIGPHSLIVFPFFCILTSNSENLCDALSSPLESIKKKLRVQPKNLWIFPDPTHRRGMRASRRDSTSPSDAPIGAFGGKNAEKRGKSSKFPTLPGEIELV